MSLGVVTGIETSSPRISALPYSPSAAAFVGLESSTAKRPVSPLVEFYKNEVRSIVKSSFNHFAHEPSPKAYLELKDGQVFEGFSFGAQKAAAGELVFQTGMVGYPESLTDPSYRGQILVITFPLVGNYGVPSRSTPDHSLDNLPKYFESTVIHVAGLVVASYAGEKYSHHLAKSSLGTWLKENGVPAMYGVDTRVLTKLIRERGNMLGRMLYENDQQPVGLVSGDSSINETSKSNIDWRSSVAVVDWIDQNTTNLVADGA